MKIQKQTQRITEMETIMDHVTEALHAGESPFSLKEDIRKLETYYQTDWINDYEADERGELPDDLKRGILSEDSLCDLLSEIDERMERK